MSAADEGRVLVLAPFGRDGPVVAEVLAPAGIDAVTVPDMPALLTALTEGAGAALITEEALAPASAGRLAAAQAEQPPWSDLPVLLLLTDSEPLMPETARAVAALRAAGNVTVLGRPVSALTLVSAVQSALRARRRQYEVRDLIVQERAAREEAEAATRIKDEFLATVSHELRTPMSTILMWAQMLAANRVTPQAMPKAARAIENSACAQSRLIEDLMDISRMLSGKLRADLREHQLAPAARAALKVVRPLAQAKGVRLTAQIDPHAGLVLLDPDRMQQVIWNLLSNAIKFTPAGGVVSLVLTRTGDHVQLQVTDTGVGIVVDLLPHVFDRFIQGGAANPRAGLGLGLAIVRQLVELHGGTVTADSRGEGQGAVFTVRLPRLGAGQGAGALT